MSIIINEHEWSIHESEDLKDFDFLVDESARRITIRTGLHPECRIEAILEAVLEASAGAWMTKKMGSQLSHTAAQVLYNQFLYRSKQEREKQ